VCKLIVKSLALAALPLAVPRSVEASGGRRPRFNVTESYHRRLVCVGRGRKQVCEAVESGSYRLSIRFPLDETDITLFNAATQVTVEIADVTFAVALGDDPAYVSGRTRALFTLAAPGPKGDPIIYRAITLSWTPKEMRIRIQGLTPDLAEPLFGWDFIDRITGRYAESAEATVSVADLTIVFEIDLLGKCVTRLITRHDEEFDISSAIITGKVFTTDWEE